MDTLEALGEVLVAILLPKLTAAVDERVKEAVAKRDTQWKAKISRVNRRS